MTPHLYLPIIYVVCLYPVISLSVCVISVGGGSFGDGALLSLACHQMHQFTEVGEGSVTLTGRSDGVRMTVGHFSHSPVTTQQPHVHIPGIDEPGCWQGRVKILNFFCVSCFSFLSHSYLVNESVEVENCSGNLTNLTQLRLIAINNYCKSTWLWLEQSLLSKSDTLIFFSFGFCEETLFPSNKIYWGLWEICGV